MYFRKLNIQKIIFFHIMLSLQMHVVDTLNYSVPILRIIANLLTWNTGVKCFLS